MIILITATTVQHPQNKSLARVQLDLLRVDPKWNEPASISLTLEYTEAENRKLSQSAICTLNSMFRVSDLFCWISAEQFDSFRKATYKNLKIDIAKQSLFLPKDIVLQTTDCMDQLHTAWNILQSLDATSPSKLRALCANLDSRKGVK